MRDIRPAWRSHDTGRSRRARIDKAHIMAGTLQMVLASVACCIIFIAAVLATVRQVNRSGRTAAAVAVDLANIQTQLAGGAAAFDTESAIGADVLGRLQKTCELITAQP